MPKPKIPERRLRHDQREKDIGPPAGILERRVTPERRHPRIEFAEFDEHIELVDLCEQLPEVD